MKYLHPLRSISTFEIANKIADLWFLLDWNFCLLEFVLFFCLHKRAVLLTLHLRLESSQVLILNLPLPRFEKKCLSFGKSRKFPSSESTLGEVTDQLRVYYFSSSVISCEFFKETRWWEGLSRESLLGRKSCVSIDLSSSFTTTFGKVIPLELLSLGLSIS